MNFSDLGLNKRILDAVKDEGYTEPSPIQQEAIPAALKGLDILGCAQTGTGKTAAFAMPIINRLIENESTYRSKLDGASKRVVRALILTPTRELALQIHESFLSYGKYTSLKCGVVIGGVSQSAQIKDLTTGLDILVATPGRLLDLLYRGYVEVSAIEVFVLDEADRMLDMGFIDDIQKIIDIIPQNRQTLFFTATMPPEIKKLTDTILNNPVSISVTPVSSTVDLTVQQVIYTDRAKKQELLIWYLKGLPRKTQALVFSRTKHGAETISRNLNRAGIRSKALHGDKTQDERQYALNKFKEGSLPVLIATDIAARGIDIDNLPLVINYDLPDSPETYVHRIGRTGRAGKEGLALTICDNAEKRQLKDVERLIKKDLIEVTGHPFPASARSSDARQGDAKNKKRFFNNRKRQDNPPKK